MSCFDFFFFFFCILRGAWQPDGRVYCTCLVCMYTRGLHGKWYIHPKMSTFLYFLYQLRTFWMINFNIDSDCIFNFSIFEDFLRVRKVSSKSLFRTIISLRNISRDHALHNVTFSLPPHHITWFVIEKLEYDLCDQGPIANKLCFSYLKPQSLNEKPRMLAT